MKRIFTGLTNIAALAGIAGFGATSFMPAHATTFSSPRLIYVASGVADWSSPATGTAVHCTNLSGQTATIKWTFTKDSGAGAGSATLAVPPGRSVAVNTENGVSFYGYNPVLSAHDFQGRVSVASTQSGVFCSAVLAQLTVPPSGLQLHIVRFNAHPGTVE